MRRDLGEHMKNGTSPEQDSQSADDLLGGKNLSVDVIIVGAGFSGVYLLHQLRRRGFTVKIIEAGSGLGGVWHWNRYPGARVDSQYPIYSLSLPEVWKDWNWSSQYPDDHELRRYFQHADEQLQISKDTIFNSKVINADWDGSLNKWTVRCNTGKSFHASFFIACTGFAAKRHFPDWKGLSSFEGTMHHSSFWPDEAVDVRGKRCAVIGSGATGIQILQEWGKQIGPNGDLLLFQRTPNLACPMRQADLTLEEQEESKKTYPEMFRQRLNNNGGYLYQPRPVRTQDVSSEEREALYEELWKMGGFRFHENNYFDMTRDAEANSHAYRFWRDRVRERIADTTTAELLAPMIAPHPFGAKRCSLESDFYDQFNKPNVHVVSLKDTPIDRFTKEGIVTSDGKLHNLDIIALATGFDAITGGLNDIAIRGTEGQLLRTKWQAGVWTYLGMCSSGFPNFFFTYGPQAPTAYSNGPSSVEIQADWIVQLLETMRTKGIEKVDAIAESEREWKKNIVELSAMGLRHSTDSWYFGSNIPGKPREPLNYAGPLPVYKETLKDVAKDGYRGFRMK